MLNQLEEKIENLENHLLEVGLVVVGRVVADFLEAEEQNGGEAVHLLRVPPLVLLVTHNLNEA